VHEDAVGLLGCLFDEVENLNCNLVVVVKEQLSVVIQPVESQILDANLSPLVLQLATCAIHDVRDLVHGQKLQILHSKIQNVNLNFSKGTEILDRSITYLWRVLISEKYAVSNLDSPKDFT